MTMVSTWLIQHWRMPLRRNTVIINLAGYSNISVNDHASTLAGLADFARSSDALILTNGLDDAGVGRSAVRAVAEKPLV